jgi:hypothetical protein
MREVGRIAAVVGCALYGFKKATTFTNCSFYTLFFFFTILEPQKLSFPRTATFICGVICPVRLETLLYITMC